MFNKILIANRGEIACRVMKTAKRMGVRTVAVYSEADARALHVARADEAHLLGPARAAESYLRIDRILEIAKKSGAQAIHPGYGFLSENAAFAEACAAAGIVFIGPPPQAIRAMGSKSAAKDIMGAAKVLLVPGYHGKDQGDAVLARAAEDIGYPVLIKAAFGGGGKGMRIVRAAADLKDAIAGARREAKSSFGDDQLLIEKYLTRPRHIEMQVFADTHGHVVHLYERDCSVQRRHQKVLEEAPAPGMTAARRKQMGEAAVACARAIGYVGAGTVEFIVDEDGRFYFMEMNTRLQVEHPVTEMVTGLDLVEWQLRVAAGERFPFTQENIVLTGHAIEARIYAEEPERDFLPAAGRVAHLRFPEENTHVRIDTGVREGDEIGVHYDPMIAKLIVWDDDRAAALRRLRAALGECEAVGLATNLQFLSAVVAHPAYRDDAVDTGFIERHKSDLLPHARAVPNDVYAIAALSEILRLQHDAVARAVASHDPHSPWYARDGWRMNDAGEHAFTFIAGAQRVTVGVQYRRGCVLLDLAGGPLEVCGEWEPSGDIAADLGGVRVRASVTRRGNDLAILLHGARHTLVVHDPLAAAMDHDTGAGGLTAPMPGTVIEVRAQPGDYVEKGAVLVILEAMKMEHAIAAPAAGTIKAVHYAKGEQVPEGAALLEFENESSDT